MTTRDLIMSVNAVYRQPNRFRRIALATLLMVFTAIPIGCVVETTQAETTAPATNSANSSAGGITPAASSESKPKSLTQTTKMSKLQMHFNELNEQEAHVLIDKGTERPWTGEYTDNKRKRDVHLPPLQCSAVQIR